MVMINLSLKMQVCSSEENGARCTDLGFTRIEHMIEASGKEEINQVKYIEREEE